jgi:hypothetical protein
VSRESLVTEEQHEEFDDMMKPKARFVKGNYMHELAKAE